MLKMSRNINNGFRIEIKFGLETEKSYFCKPNIVKYQVWTNFEANFKGVPGGFR